MREGGSEGGREGGSEGVREGYQWKILVILISRVPLVSGSIIYSSCYSISYIFSKIPLPSQNV